MAIITLTTDMGLGDYYVAAVKGAILRELPQVTIVDITHDIPKFDILKGAYNLKCAYKCFPEGSIHIVGINSLEEMMADIKTVSHIAIKASGHYFIGADTGIFSLILDMVPDEIVELNLLKEPLVPTFPTQDVFAKAACHIARGGTLEVIGKKIPEIKRMFMHSAIAQDNNITGHVIYIDSYGNIITNITKKLFEEVGKKRSFSIALRNRRVDISSISKRYNQVPESEAAALFNQADYLEIAINRGAANKLLGFRESENIRIEFHDY
jgi:S-adenosylmethionine hydrolase